MEKKTSLLIYALLADKTKVETLDKSDKIYQRLINDISIFSDERSRIITLHLYVEYWLNKLIKKKESLKQKNIDNSSFYKKTEKLWRLGVLDQLTYENLLKINELRNIYAHELELEKVDEKIQIKLNEIKIDPYFITSDGDRFRSICVQTMFLLEATYNNNCSPIKIEYPSEKIKQRLLKDGKVHWQECEILSREKVRSYEEKYKLICPLCRTGIITRWKDNTPGFKDSLFDSCTICGLTGDGWYLFLKTAKDEYKG